MSKAMDIADAIAARINVNMRLPDVSAFVDRQKDVRAEVAKRVAKAGGAAIVILYEGFSNSASNGAVNPNITRRYTVTIFAKPVLRAADETPAADIEEIVAKCIHNWEPDESKVGSVEFRVAGSDLRPDGQFLIYDLDVEALSRL
jgi:hypothetical protein